MYEQSLFINSLREYLGLKPLKLNMYRHHTIRITTKMWADKELVQRIKVQARTYAGLHPGVMVTVKKQNPYQRSGWEVVWRFLNVSRERQSWE